MALGKGQLTALIAAGAVAVGAGGAAVALEDSGTTGIATTSTTSSTPSLAVAQTAPPQVQATGTSTNQYSATFHWAGVTEAGQTGYYVYQNGTQIADVASPTYTFSGLDCGTTFAFGVAGHDGSGNVTPTSTISYSTPACPGGVHLNCFASPGACGYPDPASSNVGPNVSCSSLTSSGSVTASTPGQTVQNLNITGTLTVTAANVTVNNVCVTANGGGSYSSGVIPIRLNSTGALVENTTAQFANSTTQSGQAAINGNNSSMQTLSHVYAHNCGECLGLGPWTVSDSYIIANADDAANGYQNGAVDHYEDSYCFAGCNVSFNHDTLLNPHNQTANIFADSSGACTNHVTITNSLLAGGAFMLYPCGNATSVGTSVMNISNNNFARSAGSSADSHGYWPTGGFFGTDHPAYTFCPPAAGQTWTGNAWDDTGAAVSC